MAITQTKKRRVKRFLSAKSKSGGDRAIPLWGRENIQDFQAVYGKVIAFRALGQIQNRVALEEALRVGSTKKTSLKHAALTPCRKKSLKGAGRGDQLVWLKEG